MRRLLTLFLAFSSICFAVNAQNSDLEKERLDKISKSQKQEISAKFLKGESTAVKAIECLPDATFSNTPIDFTAAVTSNTNAGYVAAQMIEGFSDPISAIRFFGIQAFNDGSAWSPMNDVDPYEFEISFYEDNAGLPGNLITSETVSINHVNTDAIFASVFNVFHWDYIPASPIDGLTETFWIGIANTAADAWFLWIDQPAGLGTTAQSDAGVWGGTDYDAFGICIVPVLAEPGAPEAPADLVITPAEMGAVEANLTWTNPSLTFDGSELTELTTIELWVNDAVDAEYINSSPVIGGAETYDFTGVEAGFYAFTVYGTNSVGQGVSASQTVWLGNDIPAAPENVVLTSDDGNGSLTWDEPTEGFHGGYLTAIESYKIVRSDGVVVEDAYTGSQPYVDNTITEIANYSYAVSAINSEGEGAPATSNVTTLGITGQTVTVGDGTTTTGARVPLDFYYKNSISQVIYYPEELNFIGTIESIAYFNSFVTDLSAGTPVKIWIGETEEDDLSGGYIPASELTLVYDGNLSIPSGENFVVINFIEPFFYEGGNLVIMANRPMDANYYNSSDRFLQTAVPAGEVKALLNSSDSNNFDPENPPAASTVTSFANTVFFYDETPTLIPNERDFIVSDQNDVFTTVYWLGATSLEISDDMGTLTEGDDYSVVDNGDETATLTIFGSYIATKITDIEDPALVLTVTFDTTDEVEFTINPASKTIVGVHNPTPFTVLLGTTFAELSLPTEVDVDLNDGTTTTIGVTWNEDDYNGTEAGEYVIAGEFDLGTLENPSNLIAEAEVSVVYVAYALNEDFNAVAAYALPEHWSGNFSARVDGGVENSPRLTKNLYGTYSALGNWETPLVFLGGEPVLSLMYRAVEYTGYPGTATPAENFEFSISISTDFGETFTEIHTVDAANHTVSTEYAEILLDLDTYADEYAIIRIDAEKIDGDFYLDFDNVILGTFYGVEFTVTDVSTSDPIENATINLFLEGQTSALYTLTTDELGQAVIILSDGVSYDYQIESLGYLTEEGSFTISGANELISVSLEPLSVFQISGMVMNNEDPATEIVGATVALTGYDDITVQTDATGAFLMEDVFEGDYTITITADGYESFTQAITLDGDIDLGTITLAEIIVDPYSLTVDVDNVNRTALLSWNGSFGGSILLVDHDASNAVDFTDDGAIMAATLDYLELDYTIFEADATTFNGPTLEVMQQYDAVIWVTGEGWQNNQTMTATDHSNLAQYLDNGGKFILSAQDYVWDFYSQAASYTFTAGQFAYDYLGVRSVTQDVWWEAFPDAQTAIGSAGSFADGMVLDLGNIYGKKEGLTTDNITDHVGQAVIDITMDPNGVAAIKYQNAIYSSASLTAIADADARANFIMAALNSLIGKNEKAFVGFNIYLNEAETPVNAEPIEGTSYLFEDLAYGEYTASVEAVYTTGVSNKVSTSFMLYEPIVLTYSVVGENGTITATANGNAVSSGEEIPFGADLVFTATPNSGYEVKEWTVNGTTYTGFLETTLSIDDVEASTTVTVEFGLGSSVNIGTLSEVKAYPNPFNDYITVSNSTMVKRVTITNIIGQTVLDINYTGEPINTSVLSTGVYLISFEGINGERMVQKMIKK
jgi:hypothetical protein